jgi:hypothetical protein
VPSTRGGEGGRESKMIRTAPFLRVQTKRKTNYYSTAALNIAQATNVILNLLVAMFKRRKKKYVKLIFFI